ncbi:hypothetical protein MKY30_23940 [Oceanobacillus sp. FSL W8-0428]|uniref:hypothetical protein n=1 Tax=Oceanobacillus sp. FSL W8-0428 TaxID=2921715 RepID=UPI0030F5442E
MDERLEEINKQIKEIFDLRDEENRLWFNRMEEFWSDHIVELADRAEQASDLKEYQNTNSKFHADLNEFLQQRHKEIPIKKNLGRHVVDVAMTYIQQLENTINSYDHSKDLSAVVAGENMNLKIENQRYKDALEKITKENSLYFMDKIARQALEGEST